MKRSARRRGIHIPEDVAEAAALPDDLDAEAVDRYEVPDVARRRRAGAVYLGAAAVVAGVVIATGLPAVMWATAVLPIGAIGSYHLIAGSRLAVREGAALEAANRESGFPVGHASASLGFEGWRAGPVWNVLVLSADDPPSRRALVRVDGRTGEIRGRYVEDIPEA